MFDDHILNESSKPRKKAVHQYSENTLYPIFEARDLLSKVKRTWWLEQIKTFVNIPEAHYQVLYQGLIERFAEFVQILPCRPGGKLGGMLTRGLGRAFLAVQHLFTTEDRVHPRLAYAVFTSALLVDVSKVFDFYQLTVCDEKGKSIEEWIPYKGSMVGVGHYFRVRRYGGRATRVHQHATALFAHILLPREGFLWLAEDRILFNNWLSMLNEDEGGAGGLVLLLQLPFREFDEQLESKELFVISDIEVIEPAETKSGEDFMKWLQDGLEDGSILVNADDANVFVVGEGVFLADELFKEFVQHHVQYDHYKDVYNSFNHLGVTAQTKEGHAYEQAFIGKKSTKGKTAGILSKGFLGKHDVGKALGKFVAAKGKLPSEVSRQGVLVKDAKYLFINSETPSAASNIAAAYSASIADMALPAITEEVHASPGMNPDATGR